MYVYFRVGHSNPPEYFNYVDYDTWEGKGKTEVEGKEEAVSKVTMEELAGIAHEGKVRICVISDTHER